MSKGTLTIKLKEANLTRDTELVGKMDPFAIFIIGDLKAKSATIKSGGKNPKWKDQVFEFKVGTQDVINI